MTTTLVIDQGSIAAGYCVVEDSDTEEIHPGIKGKILDSGILNYDQKSSLGERLTIFEDDLLGLLKDFKFQCVAIENTFYYTQQSAASNHAMAAIRHTIMQFCKKHGIPFFEQFPQHIKLVLTGNGKAEKEELKQAVLHYTGYSEYKIKSYDHSDAIAGGIVWLIEGPEVRAGKMK